MFLLVAGCTPPLALLLLPMSAAALSEEDMRQCRAISDTEVRLRCYDGIELEPSATSAGPVSVVVAAQAQKSSVQPAADLSRSAGHGGASTTREETSVAPVAAIGKTSASTSQSAAAAETSVAPVLATTTPTPTPASEPATATRTTLTPKPAAEVDEEIEASVSARIARIEPAGYQRVRLHLEDGRVVQQIDARVIQLRVGDEVEIREMLLGGLQLSRKGENRGIRIKVL